MNPRSRENKLKKHGLKIFVALGLVLAQMTGCSQGLSPRSAGLVETLPSLQTRKGLPDPQLVKNPTILRTCKAMPDQQLQEYRGCFATYFFGMDMGINVTGTSSPGISTRFTAVVPDGSVAPVASSTGNQVSFNNGSVAFNAGVGTTSLGSGIFQVVQVAGVNNMVISNMNININIANASGLIPKTSALSFSGVR